MTLHDVVSEYSHDTSAVHTFCDNIYVTYFASHFTKIRELYSRLKSEVNPITDDELEYILITFPLELISISEKLNNLRLDREVVKLKNKEKLEYFRNRFIDEAHDLELNKSETQEFVSHSVVECMVEYEVLLTAYDSIITRVSNEQTFSKELIMGAKKVWDARRASEAVVPIAPISTSPAVVPVDSISTSPADQLPEYNTTASVPTHKAYIQ